ncbi:hypothetical protein M569_01730, partial [Genlisea aurea]
QEETWKHTLLLSFQSIGVIYGRLSTAPLYVLESVDVDVKSKDEIYELFSFIFWTLTIIPLFKYAFIVLRADDGEEGGPFALYSLLCRNARVGLIPSNGNTTKLLDLEDDELSKDESDNNKARKVIEGHKAIQHVLLFLALLGACMMLSDAVLTPSISVLAATKGLARSLAKLFSSEKTKDGVAHALKKYVPTPAACIVLVCLFGLQHQGSQKIGFIFAPIVISWLIFLTGFSLYNIIHHDEKILSAFSPVYMLNFVKKIDIRRWKLLSSIVLCIAGTEAMFADLGHFSKRSIKITFICLVYPVLLITYAGQAAFISRNLGGEEVLHLSESIPNKFLQHIFAVLAIFASAVGSQATITAGFSIINQCQALNCFPRVKVIHTSYDILGQVYVPDMNWLFMILSLAVTVVFHDVSKLARATGLAVSLGMLVTTCLMSVVISLQWEKGLVLSVCFFVFFGSIEAFYLSANVISFFSGGAWCLIFLFILFITVMGIWHYGTLKKYRFDLENKVSIEWLTSYGDVVRVPGIGFIYSDIETGIPAFFSHFIINLPAFHRVLIFVSFRPVPVPYVSPERKYLVGRVGPKEFTIYRCIVRQGYRENMRRTDDLEDRILECIGTYLEAEEGSGADSSEAECSARVGNRRVRFQVPEISSAVNEELRQLSDEKENGIAHFVGRSHVKAKKGSSLIKRMIITAFIFLDKNSRSPPATGLRSPVPALLEVGTVHIL